MSYSMSPPSQTPGSGAPRPYSPYQNAASPTNQSPYGPPPLKRQRMSPDPRSPPTNGAPYPYQQSQPHGLPNAGAYGNPYAQQQPAPVHSPYGTPGGYAQSPQSSFNTPQPYPYQQSPWQSKPPTPAPAYSPRQASPPQQQSREMMPPPPRPNKEEREERVGVEEIGDSLFGSGINLKDEENYMHTIYSNRHHTQTDSFSTNQNTSFGSSTMSPNNSFHLLTQGTSFGSQETQQAAFAGTLGHTMSQEDIEVEARRKREAAARNKAERNQHHLNNQFLLCNNVRKRMDRLAINEGVTLNVHGVWVKQPETNVMVNGNGTSGIVGVQDRTIGIGKEEPKAESLVNMGTPFESVVALISLAAGERVRGLLDEANTLARARRFGDHGRAVPPDFADIAVGEGKRAEEAVIPESLTGTQWDKVPDTANGEDVAMSNGARPKSTTPNPQPTLTFQGLLNTRLRALAEKDRAAERARQSQREKRKRAAEATATGDATTPSEPTAAPDPPPADSAAAPVKLTKKEQQRQAKERASTTDAQAHNTTNQTAAMMALGKKGAKYSWMTGGAALPTNRYAKPNTPSGAATPAAKPDSGPTTPGAVGMVRGGSGAGEAKVPEWGDWSERGKGGEGVQMRDWVLVLERDGREKEALERAMLALGK